MFRIVVSVPETLLVCFFFQAEDGIRDLVRSRGLGDVYKRQVSARLPIDDLGELFGITFGEELSENVDTVGGLLALSLIHI